MTEMFEFDEWITPVVEKPVPNAKPESALFVGPFGSGKTHTAGTAMDLPGFKKGLYIDTEGSTVGVIKAPRWDIIRVDKYPSFEKVQQLADKRGVDIDEIDVEQERFRFLDGLLSSRKKGLFHPATKSNYDVIVLDAVDVAQQFAKYNFMDEDGEGVVYSESGAVDGYKGWDNLGLWLRNIAIGFKKIGALGIFIAHETDKVVKGSKTPVPTIALQGNMKEGLPSLVDMVMRLERTLEEDEDGNEEKVTYGISISGDKDPVKDRFDFPPVIKNPNFPALFKYIDTQNKVSSNEKSKK